MNSRPDSTEARLYYQNEKLSGKNPGQKYPGALGLYPDKLRWSSKMDDLHRKWAKRVYPCEKGDIMEPSADPNYDDNKTMPPDSGIIPEKPKAIPRHKLCQLLESASETSDSILETCVSDSQSAYSKMEKGTRFKSKLKTAQEKNSEFTFPHIKLDVMLFFVIAASVLAIAASILTIHSFTLDQKWNKVLDGKVPISESSEYEAFSKMKLQLNSHKYLTKAKEHAMRLEPLEIVFFCFHLSFSTVSIMAVIPYYLWGETRRNFWAVCIWIYAIIAIFAIISATFLIGASVNIENDYFYAADQLHNFQLMNNGKPVVKSQSECKNDKFQNGCTFYENAKFQAKNLEDILRFCGTRSGFTRYFGTNGAESIISVFNATYTRSELKEIGFCSQDKFKFLAVVLGFFSGMLYSFIPVVIMCSGIGNIADKLG